MCLCLSGFCSSLLLMSYNFFFLGCDDLVLGLVGFGFGLFGRLVFLRCWELCLILCWFCVCVCMCVLHERILSSQSS